MPFLPLSACLSVAPSVLLQFLVKTASLMVLHTQSFKLFDHLLSDVSIHIPLRKPHQTWISVQNPPLVDNCLNPTMSLLELTQH